MNKICKELFGQIKAQEELKERTKAFLAERKQRYIRVKTVRRRYSVCAALCMCLLLIVLGGRWLYFTPTAQISIDINPSIELSVNRFDRVIFVNGFNEDGQKLSDALDVKYKNYAEAIEEIINYDSVTALLSDDEVMTITVIGSGGRQSAKIFSALETYTAGQSNTYCYFALPEEVAAAQETGLSCGKYRAFVELRTLDPDITPEEVQGMTMREIRELIGRLSADSDKDTLLYGKWGNGHHGCGGGHGNGRRNGRRGKQSIMEQQSGRDSKG